MIDQNEEDQIAEPAVDHGQHVVLESLQGKSDLWIDDVDVVLPLRRLHVHHRRAGSRTPGWCGLGEARGFIEDNWDKDAQRILINGRIPVNPHGGALSEGGTQGSGHTREAVHQLQGLAGERQVAGRHETALLLVGGFFFNAQGAVFRRG